MDGTTDEISEFGVPAVNLKIACDWERIGIRKEIVSKFGDLASIISCLVYFSRDGCPLSRGEDIRL